MAGTRAPCRSAWWIKSPRFTRSPVRCLRQLVPHHAAPGLQQPPKAIHFNVPSGKPAISDRPICNVLVDADYLINMPIMKKHGSAGVTLGFKNHFGSFEHCDYVHWSVALDNGNYTPDYNGLVDIYNNPHIKDKTVLTVGDALYAARFNNYDEVPSPWPSFDDQSPNSLFFSIDPVAIDSVMVDFLNEEGGVPEWLG